MSALVLLIATGVVLIVASVMILKVVRKVKSVVDPLVQISKHIDPEQMEREMEITPKSVSSMTSIYLPRIQSDFPEFSYGEFKVKAENMMKSAFNAVSASDITMLVNASKDLRSQINSVIEGNVNAGRKERFAEIDIHRTEIKNYTKSAGNCVITLQSAVGYLHYITDTSGNVIKGSTEHKFQTRYDIELMYVQDVEQTEVGGSFISNNCPNCGAPIKMLGTKSCPYCGSGVEEINVRAWSINKLSEVR
ncbi:MAG: zinc ribbon domain-containing protein [Lachnospiraceae bacterium]|nr:zinc ribbon domain-containing protein [Lachnospiraceae bacterium]